MISLKLKEETQKGAALSVLHCKGSMLWLRLLWVDPVPPKSGFLSPLTLHIHWVLWMEPVLVWTGSHAKTLFHQASAPMTGQKYLTPVSGSSLLSLDLPGSWDNANGFELTSVGKCRCWMKNWKMCSTFSSFLFYFCNLYCTHPGSHYFGHVFL